MITNSSLLQDGSGPGATPAVLEPVVKLPLRLNVGGSMGSPTLDFGEPGPMLHVVEQVDDGWISTLLWHAPTVAAGTMAILPFAVLVMVVRTARRRQEFGHYYCVRCNYDLTGPGGMPPEPVAGTQELKCTECGCDINAKPARLGRSFTGRVWKGVLTAAFVTFVCVGTLLLTLERGNPTNLWKPGWMEFLSRTGTMPRMVHAVDHFNRATHYVSTWSLPEGRRIGNAEVEERFTWMAVTKDSEWCAWMQTEAVSGATLQVLNLRTRQRSSPSLPTGGPWAFTRISPSVKPGHVLVSCFNSIQRAGPTNEAVLARVDLTTGSSSILGRVGSLHWNQLVGGGKFVFREEDQEVTWAFVTYGAGGGGTLKGSVFNAQLQEFPFEFAGTSWAEPVLSADGLSVEVSGHGPGRGLPGATLQISLADGSQFQGAPGGWWYPPSFANDGSSVRWTGASVAQAASATTPHLEVQRPNGTVIAVLSLGKNTPNLPVISRDGRWVAAAVSAQRTTWTGSPAFDAYIYVWDLQQLKQRE